MWSQSSTNPTRNRNEAAPTITQPAGVCGTRVRQVITTASQIATPPIMAVDFLCQRSVFGLATNPKRWAKTLTAGVKAAPRAKDTSGGINLAKATGIIDEIR